MRPPFRLSLRLRFHLLALIWAAGQGVSMAGPMGAFYTEEGSRRELFPGYQSVEADTLRLDDSTASKAKALLKGPLGDKEAVFEKVLFKDSVAGFIYRAQEMGKVELMDFAVALDRDGKVLRVLLTAYRESIGGEVKSKRFMGQFTGKKWGSALQLNRDIDGITGATMSSRAITIGVRKAVCFWKLKYAKDRNG